MAVIQLPQKQDDFMPALLQLFQQMDERKRGRETLAQQQSQFEQKYALDKGLTDAQIAQAGAQTTKTNYEVGSDRAGKIVEPIIKNIEIMGANGLAPDRIAEYVTGTLSRLGDDPEVKNRLLGYLQPRPELPVDSANRSQAQRDADITGRVTAGGQNPMDMDYANQRAGRAPMSASGFNYQDTAEQGPEAVKKAVAISDDRNAGATPRLASSTQIQIGREQNASAERIAALNAEQRATAAATKAGAKGGSGRSERNANLAADAVELIDDLLAHKGLEGAVGAKGASSLFGFTDTPIGGTNAASFAAKLERLRSLTTLPNLEMMRGLGAMSEKEMELVRASAGAFSRDLSEEEFKAELRRARPVLEKASKVIGFGNRVGATAQPSGETWQSPDGLTWRKGTDGRNEIVP